MNLETAFQVFILEKNSTIAWKIPTNVLHPAHVHNLATVMENGRLGF
jgi:hypothetical protein